jgi:hypothetical protein
LGQVSAVVCPNPGQLARAIPTYLTSLSSRLLTDSFLSFFLYADRCWPCSLATEPFADRVRMTKGYRVYIPQQHIIIWFTQVKLLTYGVAQYNFYKRPL